MINPLVIYTELLTGSTFITYSIAIPLGTFYGMSNRNLLESPVNKWHLAGQNTFFH